MSAPGSLIRAQISTQRLLPPGNLRRCDDGSECGRGLEPARKTERNREGAMPAHRMAEDRLAIQNGRKIRPYENGQRSEEHTSELQSLMRITHAVFCLQDKHTNQ